jgi:hypothetical protein
MPLEDYVYHGIRDTPASSRRGTDEPGSRT